MKMMKGKYLLLIAIALIATGFFSLLQAQTTSSTPLPAQIQAPARSTLDIILVGVQILTFIINAAALWGLFLYVRKTTDIAAATVKAAEVSQRAAEISQSILTEMREARDEESAPYVVLYFDVQSERNIMDLVIKNVGKSVAKNVKFEFQPPLINSDGKSVSDTSLVKNGIGSIPPGYEIRVLFDTPLWYYGAQADGNELPLIYEVKVSYTGGMVSGERVLVQNLDLSPYLGFSFLQQKGMNELVKALEKLVDSGGNVITNRLDNLSEVLKSGLWFKNTEILSNNAVGIPDTWSLIAQAKLNEFKFLWSSIYAGDINKLVNPFLNDLRVSSLILSSQILKITANAPAGVSNEIKNMLLGIASRLNELSSERIYVGKGSRVSFDNKGTEIVNLIDGVIEKLTSNVEAENIGREQSASADISQEEEESDTTT